jgi:hypothetical protein
LFVAVIVCVPFEVAVGVKLYVRVPPLPDIAQFVPSAAPVGNE